MLPSCAEVRSHLAIYSKLNLKFEVWKLLLIRFNFNVKSTWTWDIYITFTLEWHYCHNRFVETQYKFVITCLHLKYPGCPLGIFNVTNIYKEEQLIYSNKDQQFFNFKNASFILRFYNVDFYVAVHDSIARLNFSQNCQLSRINPLFKILVLLFIFPFCSFYQLFCHIIFTSLSVTLVLIWSL